ncbi:hypothetical protein SUGI_0919930 [Cryptomeria japonica]|nr:hypothetical protein SUGI_0919930 [Cryptomeria japonica]
MQEQITFSEASSSNPVGCQLSSAILLLRPVKVRLCLLFNRFQDIQGKFKYFNPPPRQRLAELVTLPRHAEF